MSEAMLLLHYLTALAYSTVAVLCLLGLPFDVFFFFNEPPTTAIYTSVNTLSLHDALPICPAGLVYNDPLAPVRIHSDSWGADTNVYDVQARMVDAFVWAHPEMTILFAAGN